jgi:deoxyribonuclease V
MPARYLADHPWNVTPQEAILIQQRLRAQVIREDRLPSISLVAGVDVGFQNGGQLARAAVALLRFPELDLVETAVAQQPVTFPYIPGLLSFREVPVILEALSCLHRTPDLLLCDGHGLAHPRRFGFASHLGLVCDLPSIGVAKSLLVGEHAPVSDAPGAWQPLLDRNETIGAAVRTRLGVKPIFVSIGHRLSLETAITYTLRCTLGYRLPEPTRQAHRLASAK